MGLVLERDRNGKEVLWQCAECDTPFTLGWGDYCNACIAAQKRLGAILGNKGPQPLPETQKAARKPRSDKGVPKKPPSSADEITLRFSIDDAQKYATNLRNEDPAMSVAIFNQIIAQLQKRLTAL